MRREPALESQVEYTARCVVPETTGRPRQRTDHLYKSANRCIGILRTVGSNVQLEQTAPNLADVLYRHMVLQRCGQRFERILREYVDVNVQERRFVVRDKTT